MRFSVFFLVSTIAASAQVSPLEGSPGFVRQQALKSPMPVYPAASIRDSHHGVAVVELLISSSGTTYDIKVLQSPDKAIAESVIVALKSWKFHPFMSDGRSVVVKSRFVFYFVLDGAGPHVTDAVRSTF